MNWIEKKIAEIFDPNDLRAQEPIAARVVEYMRKVPAGVSIDYVCRVAVDVTHIGCGDADDYKTWRDRSSDVYRWCFVDDSTITVVGDTWDIGYRDCWCWQGVGHTEDCPHNTVVQARD